MNFNASVSRINFNIDLVLWLSTKAILPSDIWQYMGTLLVVTTGQGVEMGMPMVSTG